MHPNAALIHEFYASFARRDAAGMAACYSDDVAFSDPVFVDLQGDAAKAMWRMLCARGKDLQIELVRAEADDRSGSARWDARYTFAATGRPVHNVVDARFEFRDGKIVRHVDEFDFWRWARQALGPTGLLLGWTGLVRRKVQHQAHQSLAEFMRRGPTVT